MLNLNCTICAELFGQSDDVHITICGHMFHFTCLMQWIERSMTCPQCRNRLTQRNIFRVYFNLANLDTSSVDVCSLQEKLDNLQLQLQLSEKNTNKLETEIKSLKDSQKKSMKTISTLEEKLKKQDFTILSYSEQMKILKAETKMVEELRKEVKKQQRQIETMDGIAGILSSTTTEVEKLARTETDQKRLCTWLVTLKRELRSCESKKTNLRNLLGVTQHNLRRETEEKKKLEERISQLESECYQLNDKIVSLQPSTSSKPARYSLPVKSNLTTHSRTEETPLEPTPEVKASAQEIVQSDSPYIKIKSSSFGLLPYGCKRNNVVGGLSQNSATAHTTTKLATLKISPSKTGRDAGALRKTASDGIEKYSIFKKPRLALAVVGSAGSSSQKGLASNLVFNGFGGSDKIDPFARNISEDVVEILDDVINKTPNNAVNSTSNKTKTVQIKKQPNIAISASVSERLKSGGLRNFKMQKESN